jgi:serine/threonine-protein kinase
MVAAGSVVAGRYQLQALLDAGGFGAVWQAMDLDRPEIVAIKTYDCTGGDVMLGQRYVLETRILVRISDPGVISLADHGYDPPTAWAVMPLLVGESLRTRLARTGPVVTPAVAMAWLAQAATALQAVHRLGVIHTGLRPSRLFLLADDRVVLTDFGLIYGRNRNLNDVARFADGATYLSPEQARGDRVEPATDVHHLGLVAYECLTGQPPFVAQEPMEVAVMHVREQPPPLPDEVPEPVRRVVARCLAKSPSERWPTATALAQGAAAVTL